MFYIGVVGHRYLANNEVIAFVTEQCSTFLRQAFAERSDLVALSAIAEGADTIFAEAALSLGIPLKIVRPFDGYAADFETPTARQRYEKLRAAAKSEERLAFRTRSDLAYRAAMDWIIRESDELVIVWNGRAAGAGAIGATGAAVEQLSKLERSWLYLDVVNFDVTFHQAHTNKKDKVKGNGKSSGY